MDNKGSSNFISKYARILVVIAVMLGATSGTLGKAITASPIAIGFWRLTFSLPFFAIPVFLHDLDELKSILFSGRNSSSTISQGVQQSRDSNILLKDNQETNAPGKKDLLLTIAAGFFLFAHFTCWFNAVKMTSIASASIFASLHPLVVVLISVAIYKKKINKNQIIGILVALLGAYLTAGMDFDNLPEGHLIGDINGILAALFMGIYFSIGEKVMNKISGRVYVFILFFACWFSFAMAMIVTGTPFTGYPAKDYLLLVLMALLCQIGSHAVLNLCIGHLDSVYVSAWETADSVFSITFALLLLSQMPTLWELIGCTLVVAGLLYYNYNYRDKRK